jgi:hypothetical protein
LTSIEPSLLSFSAPSYWSRSNKAYIAFLASRRYVSGS